MIRNLLVISLSAAALSSCIITPKNLVPDMPHNAMWRQRAQQEAIAGRAFLPPAQQAAAPIAPTATAIAPEAQAAAQPTAVTPKPAAVTPKPVAVTPKPATPVNKPAAKPTGNRITQAAATQPEPKPATPLVKPQPVAVATTPQPAVPPTPTPAAAEPQKDNSHIPYAVRVPGDPTRVYNPLAPDLTIRTINPATGEPLPKDTVLRVRGTDKEFRVPAW